MTKPLPVSVEIDPELDHEITEIAEALDRPKAWIVEQALREFVSLQSWQLAAIDKGMEAAEAGRVAAHEDVAAWVRSWGAPDELPPPKCG